ncbi:MAG: hypothetical protein IKB87_01695 [Clostridia bacterium]|nr:hypothetical protein [Clostridia bacterium]
MSDAKTAKSAKALLYAALSAEERDAISETERNAILSEAFAKGETAPAVGLDVLRAAELRRLKEKPLDTPDRLGRYASLLMENLPPMSVVLCLTDKKRCLLETHLLVSGPLSDDAKFLPLIPKLYKSSGAAYAAVFFAPRAAEYGFTGEDEQLATKITMYAKREKVFLLECVVASFNDYIPLYRYFNYTFSL